jgi:hypothetical protein
MNEQYYVEPTGDTETNEQIFKLSGQLGAECAAAERCCADKKIRNLIAVPDNVLATCIANLSRSGRGLRFNTLQGSEEGIVPVTVKVKDQQDQPSTSSQTSLASLDPAEIRRTLRIVPAGEGKWKRLAKNKGSGSSGKREVAKHRRGGRLPIGVTPHNARRRPGPKPKKRTIQVKASLTIRT